MGNSKIIITVVVGIIVLKLVAVHLYLRKKINETDNKKDSDDRSS